jgi:hypothetical protein
VGSGPFNARATRVSGLFALAICSSRAPAEELTALAGFTHGEVDSPDSYAYQFDYRQRLLPNLAASLAYVNEGHFVDHHRDGGAVQVWAITPRWLERFDAALGVGPYLLFDTQVANSSPWYRNVHGIGEIYTASLTYYAGTHWLARVNWTKICVSDDIGTQTLTFGVGYRVDTLLAGFDKAIADYEAADGGRALNEIDLFAGQTVVNARSSAKSSNFGVEYRRDIAGLVQLSASWLDEGNGLSGRHSGIIGEVWLATTALDPRFTIGLGAGPYVALQSYETDDRRRAGSVDGLIAMTACFRFTSRISARLEWHRAVTSDDEDRDIVNLGIGWSWGR